MTSLNVREQNEIRILSIENIDPGENIEKDSIEGVYACRVRWCPIETDAHIALLSEELSSVDKIPIIEVSSSFIEPGIYKKTPLRFGSFAFAHA